MANIYDFECQSISGDITPLRQFEGEVVLIVNTASNCGFTPQYEGLESLHRTYNEKGFSVLGFPCNQFMKQEPASNQEVEAFCTKKYQVTFPLFSKIKVNGPETAPLFRHLKKEAPGLLGTGRVKWNFTKFLVDSKGRVMKRYGSSITPEAISDDIEALLS